MCDSLTAYQGFNPLEIGATFHTTYPFIVYDEAQRMGFNPLEIGATFHTQLHFTPARCLRWQFQSPRNRGNISHAIRHQLAFEHYSAVSIP